MSADVQPSTLRPRSQAPAFIEIKLHSGGRGLLEGTLKLQAFGASRELYRQEIPDLVLMPGDSTQRLLLPPPAYYFGVEELRLQFSTGSGSYDLGRFPLVAPAASSARQYVIAICRGSLDGNPNQSLTWRALRPERLFTDTHNYYRLTPQASPLWIAPEDLPTPPGLCAFDTVLLEGGGLAALGEKQLADLTTWVEAGGSLCVVAPSAVDAQHIAFLNNLAASPGNSTPLAGTSTGAVVRSTHDEVTPAASPAFLFRRPQLGCFVLAFQAPTDEAAAGESGWVKATHFLAHSEATDLIDPQAYAAKHYGTTNRNAIVERWLMTHLPRSTRVIPRSLVLSVLTIFVVMAGPGEWFVLGWLRRRRWTWFTFPLFAVACTFFMVRAAEHYLGRDDQRCSLVIADFSPQGKALRESRFDLWLAGRNKDAVTDVQQSLVMPGGSGNGYSMMGYNTGYSPYAVMKPDPRPIYQGRLPGHYTLRRALTQWTPYIQRSFTFAPKGATPHLHWEALQESAPPTADFFSGKSDAQAEKYVSARIGAQGWKVSVFRSRSGPGNFNGYEQVLSVDPNLPWMNALSPGPRADLLDLLLDYGPGDWVVTALRDQGPQIQIERCVYHFHSNE
ncbi:hypothetical protein [Chthoniobacter flavus]|uniref:hypothetical protein n=1 Tax=Chthoniobacter flavus TaxID=191863 RepID=UPI0002F9E945|nr:hypothetical protein [Chthoniobacter flavus]